MAMNSTGTLIDCSAQTVELLLEHQSMSSLELPARIACALRNERRVKILVPLRKRDWVLPTSGCATSTLCTTWVATVPSLRKSLAGRAVLLKYGRSGWVTYSEASESPPP